MSQHEIIVRHLEEVRDWLPAHALVKCNTRWGFLGLGADRRARELATNATKVRDELRNKVERADGSDIGLDKRFTYFRFKMTGEPKATMEEALRFFEELPIKQNA